MPVTIMGHGSLFHYLLIIRLLDENDLVEHLKACLVAKEHTQTYGADQKETFFTGSKFSSIRALISLAANLDWS